MAGRLNEARNKRAPLRAVHEWQEHGAQWSWRRVPSYGNRHNLAHRDARRVDCDSKVRGVGGDGQTDGASARQEQRSRDEGSKQHGHGSWCFEQQVLAVTGYCLKARCTGARKQKHGHRPKICAAAHATATSCNTLQASVRRQDFECCAGRGVEQ